MNTFGLLKVVYIVKQLKGYKIEIVHTGGRASNQELSLFLYSEKCSDFLIDSDYVLMFLVYKLYKNLFLYFLIYLNM